MEERRRSVVLTGFMGTGKTTVGHLVAAQLDYDLVDTDGLIVERHGPIPTIFRTRGEDEFRRLERELARELAGRDGLVIATGGRMMVDPVNAEVLAATADVVCLTATVETLVDRLTADGIGSRPMFSGHDVRERITELLAERAEAYGRFTQVATDDRTPAEVAAAVLAVLTS